MIVHVTGGEEMVKVKFTNVKVGPENTHFVSNHEDVAGKLYITNGEIDVDSFVVDIPLNDEE